MDPSIWVAAIAPVSAAILAAAFKQANGHRGDDASRAFDLVDRLSTQLPVAEDRVQEARKKLTEKKHAEEAVEAAKQQLTNAQETLKDAKKGEEIKAAATAVEAAKGALEKAEALPSRKLDTKAGKSNVANAVHAQKSLEEQISRMRSAGLLFSDKYATRALSAGLPMEGTIFVAALTGIYTLVFLNTPVTQFEDDAFAFWMRWSYLAIAVVSGVTLLISVSREDLLKGKLKNLGILHGRPWPLKREGPSSPK